MTGAERVISEMSQINLGVTALQKTIVETGRNKGWVFAESIDETELVLSKLMLVVTEVAEAAEAVRKGDAENFAEELADICIHVFALAWGMKINLAKEMWKKVLKNQNRPHRHGGKRA